MLGVVGTKQRTVCKGPPVLSSPGVEELGKFQRRAVRVIRTRNEEEKKHLQPGKEMMSRVVSDKNLQNHDWLEEGGGD